jgi:hypothetical protein
MNSSVNAVSNGSANGIGNHLIGLQPPLSPPVAVAPAPVAAPAPAPAPAPVPAPVASTAPAPAPAPAPSTENLLVRFGLLTTEQVDEALRDQRGSGKHVAQIAIERGWVTRDQLAELVTQTPPQTPPPAEPEPEAEPVPVPVPPAAVAPAAEPEVAPEPEPAPSRPEAALATVARVWARLSTGDRIEVAAFGDLGEARERAHELVGRLSADRPEWPCFGGRFVRPEAIVSVDVEATLA